MQYLLSRFLNINKVLCQKKKSYIHKNQKTSLFYIGQSIGYTVIKHSLSSGVPDLTKKRM